ncbi:MAG: hypothetical protein Q7J35_05550 [Candidatus Methanoperedens sp.]|nr:hypothetical protein [Candidatus Methanoperedens sp.]
MGKRLSNKFEFLADLSSHFPDDKKPILVGGSAVELYTRGRATSLDLDLIGDISKIAPILEGQEFKREGRHFHKGLIYIEIPSDILHGEKSVVFEYDGKKIKVICVEDLIIDRLCGCKFWKSEYDCEHARMLFASYKSKMEMDYLNKRAMEEDVSELLSFEF